MSENKAKTIVITGASDGIGAEAARQLAQRGHKVVIVGRTPHKVEKIATELNAPYHIADFAKLEDVVRLAQELSTYPTIDILANNAGAIMKDRATTQDGVERTFQVNVLSPFLLTMLLADKLCASHATVIQTSSLASRLFGRKFATNDIQNENNYTPTKAYGEAKLCNILFTQELHRRYFEKGVCAVAFQPGIVRTNFAAEGPAFFRLMYHTPLKYLFTISQRRSAKRLVRLAEGVPNKDFVCGKTYSYKRLFKHKYKNDVAAAPQLWETCLNLLQDYLPQAPTR